MTVRDLLVARQPGQAMILLNSCTAQIPPIVDLRVQVLCQMGRLHAATSLIDQELEKMPYKIEPCDMLFRFLAANCERLMPSGSDSDARSDRLVIYDRIFPSLKCSFTTSEFNAYLQHFPQACVYTAATDMASLENRGFEEVKAAYMEQYPQFGGRVHKLCVKSDFRGRLLHTLFLRNIHQIIELVEKCKTPFTFTLYAGGGYGMDHKESDAMLRRVTQSLYFRAVIAVERVTRDYLLSKGFVKEEQIAFIYGPITNRDYLVKNRQPKKYYKQDKDTFDICFVSYKHSPMGRDKGYDVFIQAAHNLHERHNDIHFHVVGGFGPEDIDVSHLDDRIHFHGPQPMGFFPKFHAGMDIILSPSLPFVLQRGAFDHAPNVATVEAGLCGVAVFVADQLGQNAHLEHGKHLMIVPHDAWLISDMVEHYYRNCDELYALARRGKEKFEQVYSYESQIAPRIKLLEHHLNV